MKKFLIGLVIVLVIIIVGLVVYYQQPKSVLPVACTEEAKLCPDGVTSVGRQGPNCEFAPCPVAQAVDETADWKTYKNDKYGFEFKYPADWKIGDSSYTYEGVASIYFRVMAPFRIIPQSNGQPVSFDMLVCKINGVFTNRCFKNGGEGVSFDYAGKPGAQAVSSVEGISDFITTTPEYLTALKILKSAK
jgi:hypothetical protein